MAYTQKNQILWGLGLSDQQAQSIRALAGPKYTLQTWPVDALPDFRLASDDGAPRLIACSMAGCRAFVSLPIAQVGHLDLLPKLLLLDENASQQDLEEALDFGVSDIVRPPLTKKRFAVCLRRAAEAAALHRDIQNMTREIFLDRELLERKNETLNFLVNFLAGTSDSFDESDILRKAHACLQSLFPVLTMHAALFEEADNGDVLSDLYIAAPKDHASHANWRDLLLEHAASACPGKNLRPVTIPLHLTSSSRSQPRPGDGHLMTLPLVTNEGTLGLLLLLTSMERNFGRDQGMALDSALRHLALSLKNARRFQQVSRSADSDSLTGVYNRRHFERTASVEIGRHQRYKQPMSLLMLDIDHFKTVNDTWGHQAGDTVLRSVTQIITDTIRQTDYCARYGGEEFVILLPHTDRNDALLLADRLRRAIERHQFAWGNSRFTITASLGVACLAKGDKKDVDTLTHEADLALYQAKGQGRNRVVAYLSAAENGPALAM